MVSDLDIGRVFEEAHVPSIYKAQNQSHAGSVQSVRQQITMVTALEKFWKNDGFIKLQRMQVAHTTVPISSITTFGYVFANDKKYDHQVL